jgi:hypothetical protein
MPRSARLGLVLVAVVAVAIGGYVGLKALWNTAQKHLGYDHCTVGGYDLDPEQAAVAATMTGAVAKYSPALPQRATILVIAAALQESKLRNLPQGAGDRDSVGVLQQRPSQGWGGGDARRLNDVGEATREFLAAMVKVPHWQKLPLAEIVQDVQISADGSAYAAHEPEATAIARALDGTQPRAIACNFAAPTKVAATTRVADLVRSDLPINAPRTTSTEVHVRGAHWQTAAWFVAYSYQLGIEQVSYAGYTWRRSHGWHASQAASTEVVATMYQRS